MQKRRQTRTKSVECFYSCSNIKHSHAILHSETQRDLPKRVRRLLRSHGSRPELPAGDVSVECRVAQPQSMGPVSLHSCFAS